MPERDLSTEAMPEVLGAEAYRAIYDYSPDGVLFTAPDGRVLAANPAACEILGRQEAEICALGRQGMMDHTDVRWADLLAERMRTGVGFGVARMVRGDGTVIEVEMGARVFTTAAGEQRTCTIIRDVTERINLEHQLRMRLRELAVTDELTGLRNRRGFIAIGEQLLELADRERATVGVLFLDIDNMKRVNDRYGHRAGDHALRVVAGVLREALRDADTVARIGGDEFVALAIGLGDGDRVAVESRIRDRLAEHGPEIAFGDRVEVSVGWGTRLPDDPKTIEELLVDADDAMYLAKSQKRSS